MKCLFAVLFSVILILGATQCTQEEIAYYGCTVSSLNKAAEVQKKAYDKNKNPTTCKAYYDVLNPLYEDCLLTMNAKDKETVEAILATLFACFDED